MQTLRVKLIVLIAAVLFASPAWMIVCADLELANAAATDRAPSPIPSCNDDLDAPPSAAIIAPLAKLSDCGVAAVAVVTTDGSRPCHASSFCDSGVVIPHAPLSHVHAFYCHWRC